MLEAVSVSFALFLGLASRFCGLPPLIGFLAAGFLLNYMGPSLGLPEEINKTMGHLGHLGVLILLFAVGLKLKFKQVLKPEVFGGSLIHFAIVVAVFYPVVHFAFNIESKLSLILAISLGFSSTVLAAKLLETKRELSVFHGRTTIGILIIQDIIALAVLAAFSGQTPNLGVLVLLGIPLFRIALHKIVDVAGHGELMVLVSMFLAIVVGGAGFTAMGLSSEIGALVVGALVANHPKSAEMSTSLLSLKELLLVCFFLSIGLSGLLTAEHFIFAAAFVLLLPIKGILFFAILVAFKLRARTAFLSALSLMCYSEFGLIVAAGLAPEYMVPLALTLSFSYLIAAPMNRYAHQLFEIVDRKISRFEFDSIHPDEQPKDLKDANVLIFGMGRTGSAAYAQMEESGFKPVGLDADTYLIESHTKNGRNALFADAEDSQFWRAVDLDKIQVVILALDDIEAKLISVRMLRKLGYDKPIISHCLHEDHQERLIEAGATNTYLTMKQAGKSLADKAKSAMDSNGNGPENSPDERALFFAQ